MRTDPEALTVARKAVGPGERVLWAARASGWRWPGFGVLHPAVLLAACGGTIGWHVAQEPARSLERWPFLLVMSLPVWVFAAWLALAIRAEMRAAGGVYAVTDRRVLILDVAGIVRAAVGLDRAGEFTRVGRAVHLGGEREAHVQGRRDLDGGLERFEALPKLERLAEPEGVLALIRRAAEAD